MPDTKLYTDEEWFAVREILFSGFQSASAGATSVLDAVAPAIAARALRNAADESMRRVRINPLWLREMADEIEESDSA